jgi:mannose-6-phosphate isomerase-like protein (cupin superfamily)
MHKHAQLAVLAVGLFSAALVVPGLVRAVAGQAPASAPATYLSNADLAAALKKATEANPNMSSARIQNTDHYRINIVRRGRGAGALAHVPGTELHYIIEGAGTLVTGGRIVRPAAGATGTATIEGGETRRVAKGDAILVPEGTPHWYKDVEGAIAYLEVRFNVPVGQ